MTSRVIDRTLWGVALSSLLLMALLSSPLRANAQGAPTIQATPTGALDTYQVTGTGFTSGTKYKVIEVTCGPLPCAAGGGAIVVATADSNGRFSVALSLSDIVPTDRDFRVIAAFPDDRAGLATDPQVQVPVHTSAAPKPPATGDGFRTRAAGRPFSLPGTGLLVLAAITGLAAVVVRRRG